MPSRHEDGWHNLPEEEEEDDEAWGEHLREIGEDDEAACAAR